MSTPIPSRRVLDEPKRQATIALTRQWRAAAWLLERRNPEDFAARGPRLFSAQQVSDMLTQVVELLRGDVAEENCRRALGKFDEWLFEFNEANRPVVVEGVKDEGGAMKDGGGREKREGEAGTLMAADHR